MQMSLLIFQIISFGLDELSSNPVRMHICRFANFVVNIKHEFSYMWPCSSEQDVCAICLECLHQPPELSIDRGRRTWTALERLRPRFRTAASHVQREAVLVRMGPCQHVFHR